MWNFLRAWLTPEGQKVPRPYPTALGQQDVSADLVAASGANVDYSSNPLKAIYVGDVITTGSLVYVKMLEDSGFFEWDCVQGMYIEGVIVGVGGSTTAEKLVGLR
jgi:hypothetical protein